MPRHHMMSVKHNNRSSVGLLRILKVNQENKYKDKQRESFCVSPRSTLHIETFFRQVSRLFLHSQSSKHNIYIYKILHSVPTGSFYQLPSFHCQCL